MTDALGRLRAALILCGALAASSPLLGAASPAAPPHGGPHDFDFEFGAWQAHLSRLVHPLTGSHTWVDYEGTSVVRPVWNGKANLGEFEVTGPAGHIEGLTLRLYDPQARRWLIHWANSHDGELGMTPMVGGFQAGRGVFYDRETLAGRPIAVRFVFANLTRDAFTLEQAYSADDGRTWETNWRASFTRSRLARSH